MKQADFHLPELTLCLIVKDEEAFLPQCLAATVPHCADVVIVDTGSSDRSLEIAGKYTDKVFRTTMDQGYSAARNIALDHVRTPWVLFLDADEVFIEDEWRRIAEEIRGADERDMAFRVMRFNLTPLGGVASDRTVRIFRNHPEIRYRRRVGESVEEAVEDRGGRIVNSGLMLNHFGGVRPVGQRAAKTYRYIELTKQQIHEYPGNGMWVAYVGFLLRLVGEIDEALPWSTRAVELEPSSPRAWSHHGHVLRAAGRTEDSLRAFETAAALEPGEATFRNMVGVMNLASGRLDQADADFVEALRLEPSLLHAEINRGLVLQAREDYPGAAEIFGRVADRNPGLLLQDWRARVEVDHFTYLFNETAPHFAGLAYHLGYCRLMAETPGAREIRYPVDGYSG
ncbi:glycosyltransferase [Streptomyces sp. NPDC001770]